MSYTDSDGVSRVGVVVDGQVRGLAPGTTLVDLLDAGAQGIAYTGETLLDGAARMAPGTEVRSEVPLAPRSIRDGAGLVQHPRNCAARTGRVIDRRYTDFPPFFFSNP